MSREPIEVDLGSGILSFDGHVVEAFGFTPGEVKRVHIDMVERVELRQGRWDMVSVEARSTAGFGATLKLDDSRRPAVEAWMQAVRDAAPNLKEG